MRNQTIFVAALSVHFLIIFQTVSYSEEPRSAAFLARFAETAACVNMPAGPGRPAPRGWTSKSDGLRVVVEKRFEEETNGCSRRWQEIQSASWTDIQDFGLRATTIILYCRDQMPCVQQQIVELDDSCSAAKPRRPGKNTALELEMCGSYPIAERAAANLRQLGIPMRKAGE